MEGNALYTTAGRPIAVISQAMIEYRPRHRGRDTLSQEACEEGETVAQATDSGSGCEPCRVLGVASRREREGEN